MMQPSDNMRWLPIVAVVAAVLLGMFMGRRAKSTGTRMGWWVGLIVLLVLLSLTFGYTSVRIGDQVEQRQGSRSGARVGVYPRISAEVQERVREGMREAARAGETASQEMRDAFRTVWTNESPPPRPRTPRAPLPPPLVVKPTQEVHWMVVIDEKERSKDESVVRDKAMKEGLVKVRQWVKDQLKLKDDRALSELNFKEKELFPEGIVPQVVKIPLPDGSDEQMYEASAKLVLSPALQERILAEELASVSEFVNAEVLRSQAVLLGIILCITGGAALLGSYRLYRRWVQERFTAPAAAH